MFSSHLSVMPSLVSDLIIDTDSESEDEVLPKTPTTPVTLQPFITQSHKSTHILSPNQRPIAGSKRVYRFRETQGLHVGQAHREVLQSITASPALGHISFEELRTECYMQSKLATGSPPKPVDPTKTPWAVIPPAFNAFPVISELQNLSAGDYPTDVVMSD
ncbi:hypothetical protein P691DRAFT_265262 [Macrolepiota fuliginosa MF-IS2]|uniref:Uncharacterized protein n=1 Tax=Macrolepiota fuliginosa MF-IS2 TaxID=1400762 RepID=A0A9P5X7H4_9AGAR|nr:hypothetical protein P691DRAFT_265262 [Macrolepiota fuliginosa MF-IS2]